MKREAFQRAATVLVMFFACVFLGTGGGVASAEPLDRTADVEWMQAQYAKTVTAEEYEQTIHLYDRMLAAGSAQPSADSRHATQVASGEFCGTIPREAGVAYGWYLKVRGAVSGVGAIAVGAVNVPAGVAIGALGMAQGLSGDAVIAWSEANLPKKICVTWS